MQTNTKAYNIALVGILSVVNAASRVLLPFLPNIKPVTSIVIITPIYFGLFVAAQVVVTTTLLSGLLLGMGPYIVFQIAAWMTIVLVTGIIRKYTKQSSVVPYTVWAGFSGLLFGFVVSLEMLLHGWPVFIGYYIAGIPYDLLHALGNVLFFPVCYWALSPLFRKAVKKRKADK